MVFATLICPFALAVASSELTFTLYFWYLLAISSSFNAILFNLVAWLSGSVQFVTNVTVSLCGDLSNSMARATTDGKTDK